MIQVTKSIAMAKDKAFALDVHHKGYRDTIIKQFGKWDTKEQDVFFERSWQESTYEILHCNGKMCGYISEEQREDCAYVCELVIHPDFQGKGVGRIVLQDIIDRARMRRLPVMLQVLTENSAVEFYLKCGFVEYERTDNHVLMRRDIF